MDIAGKEEEGTPRKSWREDGEEAMTSIDLEEHTCFERNNWLLATESDN